MSETPFTDMLDEHVQRLLHKVSMDIVHDAWEALYGTPCGPYDERRAGRPMGIMHAKGRR